MAATPQDRIDARDAAQQRLDAAVLLRRREPSDEHDSACLAAMRTYVDASQAVIADELIAQQQQHPRSTCGRCHQPIEFFRGYWWTEAEWLCPDGEAAHYPVRQW